MTYNRFIGEEAREAGLHAFYEVVFITALSLLPLLFIAYYQYVEQPKHIDGSAGRDLWDFVYNNVAAGQLAFYAIANWATVAWICGIERKLHIPARHLFILCCIIGFGYCSILIAITAAANFVPSSAVTVPSGLIYLLSIGCYILLLLFQKLKPPSVEDTNISQAGELHRKVNVLRGGGNG
jgi:hypothetical protein